MSTLETRFPKKRMLITGATSGFGEALAYAMATRGWNVVVTGLVDADIERTVQAVVQRGGKALGLKLNVCDRAQWGAVRQEVQKTWGGIDILVNNAGVADANKMVNMTDNDWESMLSVNLDGVINGCRTYAPDMLAEKSGYLLNMASAAGLFAFPEMANYSVSKAGVIALSETLFTELSVGNIGVTVLCPAGFKSPLLENSMREGLATAASGSSTGRIVKRDMDSGRHTSETVAAFAIRAMEQGNLYAIPQFVYRIGWLAKRLAPNNFYKLVGWMYRNQIGPFKG